MLESFVRWLHQQAPAWVSIYVNIATSFVTNLIAIAAIYYQSRQK
jgi:hypothetical protein